MDNLPLHIGFIMDGNRRWAKAKNQPSVSGHLAGYETMKTTIDLMVKHGVTTMSFFVFSTENWKRAAEEVGYLMKLAEQGLKQEIKRAQKNNWQIIFSGRIDQLPGGLPVLCHEAMDSTKNNTAAKINFCFNYGGHLEIVDAIKKIIDQKIPANEINEKVINSHLYQNLPAPDLIVRTSGEQRLSGFLLWQSAYSELIFLKKYWPDFGEDDLVKILEEYSSRQRRFGGN